MGRVLQRLEEEGCSNLDARSILFFFFSAFSEESDEHNYEHDFYEHFYLSILVLLSVPRFTGVSPLLLASAYTARMRNEYSRLARLSFDFGMDAFVRIAVPYFPVRL